MNFDETGSEATVPAPEATGSIPQETPEPEADIFDTGQGLPQIKREPELHRGAVLAVSSSTFDSGATAIVFHLKSLDAEYEGEYLCWVPRAWVENIYIPRDELPQGEVKVNPRTGKSTVVGNQREQLAIRVYNSDGTAELQRITEIARSQGRTAGALGLSKPADFGEYVSALSQLLAGVQVVFRRAADANAEPQFRNVLKVQGIYDPEAIVNNPKRLRDHVRMWEQQA